jgi:hypothetical protein
MVVRPFVVLSTERKQVVGVWPVITYMSERGTGSGHALALGFLAEDLVEIVADSIEWSLLPVRETTRACPLWLAAVGLLQILFPRQGGLGPGTEEWMPCVFELTV